MSVERDFPTDEQRNRKREETPCVWFHYEKKGCEHHCIIPVVNPAGATACIDGAVYYDPEDDCFIVEDYGQILYKIKRLSTEELIQLAKSQIQQQDPLS